jgi:hypothetical protein
MVGRTIIELRKLSGWFDWAGRHPAVVLLGALAVAIVALQQSPGSEASELDGSGEEVPLFI